MSLEPKVMDLLLVLTERAGQVVGKDALLELLWPGVIVGEDTLARTISKLRNALDDSAKSPEYIETVPKRGYRLIAPVASLTVRSDTRGKTNQWWSAAAAAFVAALVFSWWNADKSPVAPGQDNLMMRRADDFYMRFTQVDNAAAMDLYERVIAEDPENGLAHAGLASTLVQRVIRYPEDGRGADSVGQALASGMTQTPQAKDLLSRAIQLAERSVHLAPDEPLAYKALGLALAVSGDLEGARQQHEKALERDEFAWEPLINLGELATLDGRKSDAITLYSRAYNAMQLRYDEAPQRIGPWHAPLGATIARMYREQGDFQAAEVWYRRILRLSPYEPEATGGLAQILARSGDLRAALSLCRNLSAAGSGHITCDELLANSVATP